ncbi:hypothetical protein BDF19DRAFT_85869 [Syncephalis fuscata]|nr:hypothetical protein BDF19DRAFT_85869 [Syncephalis fuscata]
MLSLLSRRWIIAQRPCLSNANNYGRYRLKQPDELSFKLSPTISYRLLTGSNSSSDKRQRTEQQRPKRSALQLNKVVHSVIHAGKTTWYLGLIVLGTAVFGTVTYALYRELLASDSTAQLYAQAWSCIESHDAVKDKLGEPLTQLKDRRRHRVAYTMTDQQNQNHYIVYIPVTGSIATGEAYIDAI